MSSIDELFSDMPKSDKSYADEVAKIVVTLKNAGITNKEAADHLSMSVEEFEKLITLDEEMTLQNAIDLATLVGYEVRVVRAGE